LAEKMPEETACPCGGCVPAHGDEKNNVYCAARAVKGLKPLWIAAILLS
jgi:hypothetical protein